MRSWAIGVAGFAASACLPFGLPPGQASIGTATTGTPTRQAANEHETTYSLRGTMYPLELFDDHQTRTLDFGTGYGIERVARRDGQLVAQGPYLELAAYPLRARTGAWLARAGLRTSADLLIADEGAYRAGYGGSVALAGEIATFGGTGLADNGFAAIAYGEVGLGGYIGVSHRRFREDAYWLASAGVSLRLPAVAGLLCCAVP